MDLVEMVLAKADTRIHAMYDKKLVPENLWPIGEEIRARYVCLCVCVCVCMCVCENLWPSIEEIRARYIRMCMCVCVCVCAPFPAHGSHSTCKTAPPYTDMQACVSMGI